jgi:hypothetical protein
MYKLIAGLCLLLLSGAAVATTEKVHLTMSGTLVDYRSCCDEPQDALIGNDWSIHFEFDQTPTYSETNYPGSLGYNHRDIYSYLAEFTVDGQVQQFNGSVEIGFSWAWCYDDWCSNYDAEFGDIPVDLNVDGFQFETLDMRDISLPRPEGYGERYTFDTTAASFLNLNDPGVYMPLTVANVIGDGDGIPIISLGQDSRYAYIGASTIVPIPAAVWLFGSALAGLGWMRQKQTVS